MWGGNGLKWKFSLQTISKLTRKERERSHPERDRTQSLEPFDFAPFDFDFESHPDRTLQLRRRTQSPSTSHPSTSLFDFDFESHPDRTLRLRQRTQSLEPFDFAPFNFTIRLRLWIAPRSHPSTSPKNPEPRSRLRLRRDRTPRSHQDGTDCIDRTEIAIEKWLGFD